MTQLTANAPHQDSLAQCGRRLRLLSYNIQAGISTRRYHHYVTGSWKHLLNHPRRQQNLDRIASLLHEYDLVGLQEADAGSLRTGDVNLTEYLAKRAGFPHWYDRANRNMGRLAQHSLGMLSRFQPDDVQGHELPGPPGRGALTARFGTDGNALMVVILHLALGRRARKLQLEFLREINLIYPHMVVMGDMNFPSHSQEMRSIVRSTSLRGPTQDLKTFPSWRPRRSIDHILVSEDLEVETTRVLSLPVSDHLPLCMDVRLPNNVALSSSFSPDNS